MISFCRTRAHTDGGRRRGHNCRFLCSRLTHTADPSLPARSTRTESAAAATHSSDEMAAANNLLYANTPLYTVNYDNAAPTVAPAVEDPAPLAAANGEAVAVLANSPDGHRPDDIPDPDGDARAQRATPAATPAAAAATDEEDPDELPLVCAVMPNERPVADGDVAGREYLPNADLPMTPVANDTMQQETYRRMATDQARLAQRLGGRVSGTGGTPADPTPGTKSRKRLATVAQPVVSLHRFVATLIAVFGGAEYCTETPAKVNINPLPLINQMLERSEAEPIAAKIARRTAPPDEKPRFRQMILNGCINAMYQQLDKTNVLLAFPRDAFKLFLAYYKPFIGIDDFCETGKLPDRRSNHKSNALLGNGSFLLEFLVKGCDFTLSRVDPDDLEAIKMCLNHELTLPAGLALNAERSLPADATVRYHTTSLATRYLADAEVTFRADHLSVAINNSKLMYLLVTCDLVMIYDAPSGMFIPPALNVDRKIPYTVRTALRHNEYLLLEVVFVSNRMRIVDVIVSNVSRRPEDRVTPHAEATRACTLVPMPAEYGRRLEILTALLPTATVATPLDSPTEQQPQSGQVNYLQKPRVGSNLEGFIFYRAQTAAVVGTYNKMALYAYRDDESKQLHLQDEFKTLVSGPTSLPILARSSQLPSRASPAAGTVRINLNGEEYTIAGTIPPGATIFTSALVVELNDGRLANLSNRSVRRMCEIPPSKRREPQVSDLKRQLMNMTEDTLLMFHKWLQENAH